ncbi:MAG: hydantoinase B/oxoprolinase family protein [Nitrososphaerota archaeon]
MRSLDIATLSILWDKLISIADEGFAVLVRTSFSPIVREALDATCQLFDDRGRAIAQAWSGPPSFTGTLPVTLANILKKFPPETLKQGDVLATNDPWIGTGHLNDICIIRPIFREGELLAYSGAVSHLPDIGGALWSATADDVYSEGLRIPPCKLMEAGVRNRLIFEFIESNVRTPEQTIGDIMSDIATVTIMDKLLNKMMLEYGITDPSALWNAIIDRTGQTLMEELSRIPHGSYFNERYVEGFNEDHLIKCRVTVRGDKIVVDYDGTSSMSNKAINCPLQYTRAYTLYAVKCVLNPAVPNNHAIEAIVDVKAPEGCILNPRPPAATGARHITGWHTPLVVWGALSQAVPDRVIAESGLPSSCTVKGEDRRGKPFIAIVVIGTGGTGARPEADGLDSTAMPTVTSLISVEQIESTSPLLVEYLRLIRDSGGAGKFRGGLAAAYSVRNISGGPIRVAFIGNQHKFPPKGILGGLPGTPRRVFIDDKEVSPMGVYEVGTNSCFIVENAGGGGFLNPDERDFKSIRDDLDNGFISEAAARNLYHLVEGGDNV